MDDKDTSLIGEDEIVINIDDYFDSTISVDTTNMNSTYYSIGTNGATGSSNYGNITIGTSNSGFNGSWSNSYMTSGSAGLHVTANAEFEGDVKIKGVSILETLQKIEKRLAILRPDPEKLEHFEALRKAYEHYKTLEALCEVPKKEEE
jgi:hypothetical protein